MFASLKANEYDKVLESATTILSTNYLDIMVTSVRFCPPRTGPRGFGRLPTAIFSKDC